MEGLELSLQLQQKKHIFMEIKKVNISTVLDLGVEKIF